MKAINKGMKYTDGIERKESTREGGVVGEGRTVKGTRSMRDNENKGQEME